MKQPIVNGKTSLISKLKSSSKLQPGSKIRFNTWKSIDYNKFIKFWKIKEFKPRQKNKMRLEISWDANWQISILSFSDGERSTMREVSGQRFCLLTELFLLFKVPSKTIFVCSKMHPKSITRKSMQLLNFSIIMLKNWRMSLTFGEKRPGRPSWCCLRSICKASTLKTSIKRC